MGKNEERPTVNKTRIQSISFYNDPDLSKMDGEPKFEFYDNPENKEVPHFDQSIDDKIKFCPYCGIEMDLESDQKSDDVLKFCPYCGKNLE